MKVIQKGHGTPKYAIIGSVHGDEPAGQKAIQKILEKNLDYKKPVKFIIANERALQKDKRYLDTDLNRSLPGNPKSKLHEEKLAHNIREEIKEKIILDIHTTKSYSKPFATIKSTEKNTLELVKAANIDKAVYFPEKSGTLIESAKNGLVAETGLQKSAEAVENAVEIILNFLSYFEIIDQDFEISEPHIYKYIETVEGNWKFLAENFTKVKSGEIYAEKNGKTLKAEKEFYPALMSTNGYKDILGFKTIKMEK